MRSRRFASVRRVAAATAAAVAVVAGTGMASASAATTDVIPTQLSANPSVAQILPGLHIYLDMSATLTTQAGVPVPGQQIVFGGDGQGICAARTNLAGVASCGGLLNGVLQSILGFGYQAAYLGNGVFGDSSANAPVISLAGIPILGL